MRKVLKRIAADMKALDIFAAVKKSRVNLCSKIKNKLYKIKSIKIRIKRRKKNKKIRVTSSFQY